MDGLAAASVFFTLDFATYLLLPVALVLQRALRKQPGARYVLFAVVFICFRVVEDVLVGLWDGKSFLASIPVLGGGGIAGYLSIGIILASPARPPKSP